MKPPEQRARGGLIRGKQGVWAGLFVLGFSLCGGAPAVRAAVQFDVFVGYGSGGGNDGLVREAGWFPVACEVFNDGPGFDAVVEFSTRQLGGGQNRRMTLELPTGTRKRFVFPMFGGASRYASWDARLYDARGKLRAERTDLRTKDLAWETFLLGGLPRTFGGLPAFPTAKANRPELQPQVARMTAEQMPENPIALEGLNAVYINSEKALGLQVNQVSALLSWVHGGGHLIVGTEQAQDISSTPWLRNLFPCEVTGSTTNRAGAALQAWLEAGATLKSEESGRALNFPTAPTTARPPTARPPRPGVAGGNPYAELQADLEFDGASFPIFTGPLRDGVSVVAPGGLPLVVNASRGRGQITALLFSPEREPFRSWKHRTWFWARLLQIPGEAFLPTNANIYGGWSMDGVFGAMIDTRQVRKLPVEWLLALLVVYLVVIGPLDQWWLKRINRQMLTWITFPAYVVLFSLLIYYIGYRLRAGETEWNELHLVDVLPRNERVELRGRTYASLYSSSNARYKLASDQPFATMRSEFVGLWGGGQESSRTEVELRANSFRAEVAVPVWTSLLYVTDWEQPSPTPLTAAISVTGNQLKVTVENRLPRRLSDVRMAYQSRLYSLGELGPNQIKTQQLELGRGQPLPDFVRGVGQRFQQAVSMRRQAFGRDQSGRLEASPENAIAASFISQMGLYQGPQRAFIYPAGLDLSPQLARGEAVLLAWDPGHSVMTGSLPRFAAPRSAKNTLLRLAVPLSKPTG